jgi:hypothetical protein
VRLRCDLQVYGGLVYMDFDPSYTGRHGHGSYTPLDARLLPPLHLVWAANPSDSGKVHSTVRRRWLDGDATVHAAMAEVASLPQAGRCVLLRIYWQDLLAGVYCSGSDWHSAAVPAGAVASARAACMSQQGGPG